MASTPTAAAWLGVGATAAAANARARGGDVEGLAPAALRLPLACDAPTGAGHGDDAVLRCA